MRHFLHTQTLHYFLGHEPCSRPQNQHDKRETCRPMCADRLELGVEICSSVTDQIEYLRPRFRDHRVVGRSPKLWTFPLTA